MKIAMLNCLKANEVCGGVACLRAFNAREAGFARYAGEELQLMGFLRCSNCGKKPEEDRGMKEKLERLVSVGTEAVHIGICAQMNDVKCETMGSYAEWLEDHGVEVVWRTHDWARPKPGERKPPKPEERNTP